jgi:hypothetical protein
MTGLHTRAGQGGGLVPRHLARLHAALGGLAEQTRDALARTLADAAADLVGQAVRAALGAPGDAPAFDPWRDRRRAAPSPVTDPFEELYGFDPEDPEDPEDRWYRDLSPPPEVPHPPEGDAPEVWPAAVALGLRAAAWWLGRRTGRPPLLAALALGTVAAAVAAAGGPAALAGLGMAESLLGLASLPTAPRLGPDYRDYYRRRAPARSE